MQLLPPKLPLKQVRPAHLQNAYGGCNHLLHAHKGVTRNIISYGPPDLNIMPGGWTMAEKFRESTRQQDKRLKKVSVELMP